MLTRYLILALVTANFSCKKKTTASDNCFPEAATSITSICCFELFSAAYIGNDKAVTVALNDTVLALGTECRTFRIQDYTAEIKVKYYTHANHPDSVYFNFCSDLFYRHYGTVAVWDAVSGSITAAVSKPRSQRQKCEQYQTSIRLDNVKFINGTRDTTISTLTIKDKLVYACIP